MRAVRMTEFGEPPSLRVEEVPDVTPSGGDALIEVRAAAVNPFDLVNLAGKVPSRGGRPARPLPRTPGRDYAGVVVRGPDELIGQEVWGTSGGLGVTYDGSHAGYVVVPASSVRRKPANLPYAEAGAIGITWMAPWLCLSERADVQAGEIVLIMGAGGAVGRAATQIAHWRGARVIGADRKVPGELDVDDAIDTSGQDLAGTVRELTGGVGVDVTLDAVGGPVFAQTLSCLRHGGRGTVISSGPAPEVSFSLLDFYRDELTLMGVSTVDPTIDHAGEILEAMRPGFESGALRPLLVRTFTLDDAVAAYEAVRLGTGGAKAVLVPHGAAAARQHDSAPAAAHPPAAGFAAQHRPPGIERIGCACPAQPIACTAPQ